MSAMRALPVKGEYGPTLGRLASPRWRAASRGVRVALTAAGVALVALLLALGLTLENSKYSRGGRVPFHFEDRELYRVAPEAGGFVKVESRWPSGALKYSFAVAPIELPPYAGELTAEMPLFATAYIHGLERTYAGFRFSAEGKTAINKTLTGYEVAFYARVEGREMYVRNVLLIPPRAHQRAGVVVSMLTAPKASAQVSDPQEVGETGVLLRPLKTFGFG
jgi:hypothetical protein